VPKMKSHRGAAKRFWATSNGKLLRRQTRLNHLLGKKSPARKRRLARTVEVVASERRSVRRMLGR
jgi:large subunit ribosomal protein L35